jgi:[acyl-carrier-protein] S-malonyltransferase
MLPFAFVFPGQGSQSVGMLDAWGDHPAVAQTLAEASEALHEDLGALIRQGPKERLDLTENTQPVMLVAGVACFRAWMAETGAAPMRVAGHSLGEYSALVASGALALADAVPLVRLRAQAMQRAVPVGTGAMAAILGLDAATVVAGCTEVRAATGEVVEAANFNDPKQTVIAGSTVGVNQACNWMKAHGAKRALPLAVSAPFHSSLMRPAADMLASHLPRVSLSTPAIALVNNVDVQSPVEPDGIRDALVRQAFSAVRWVEVVQRLKADGAAAIVECGPGKVLSGLVKRIDAEIRTGCVMDPASLAAARGELA